MFGIGGGTEKIAANSANSMAGVQFAIPLFHARVCGVIIPDETICDIVFIS